MHQATYNAVAMPSYVPGYDTEGLLPYVIWGVSQDRPLPEVLMGSPADFLQSMAP